LSSSGYASETSTTVSFMPGIIQPVSFRYT